MAQLILIIVAGAVGSLILLLGGLHSDTSLPAYGLIALAGILSIATLRTSQIRNCDATCLATTAVFLGYVISRAVVSPDAYIAREDLYLALASSILYLIFTLSLASPRLRIRFVFILLVLAAANSIVGGIQFFKGHNFMPFDFLPRGSYGARASGFYSCPNHLAGFLEIVMLFGLSLACWSRSSLLVRIAAGYGSAMCAAGIVISGSRGGYASSAVGLAAFGFISLLQAGKWLRREFWYAVIACTIVGAAAGGYVMRSVVGQSDFLQHRVNSASFDVSVRVSLAKPALQQFQINPWFGTGSRTYLYYGRQFRDSSILTDPIYAHNDYLQLLAEYGLFGVAGLVVLLAFHLRHGWKVMLKVANDRPTSDHPRAPTKRSGKGSRSRSAWRAVADEDAKRLEQRQPAFKGSHSLALMVAAFSSVIAYLAHSMVDFNMHIPANACVMAFVFAILANPGTNSPADGKDSEAASAPRWLTLARFAPSALGLCLLFVALPKWPAELYCGKARRLLSDWRMLDSIEFAKQAEAFARKGLGYDSTNPNLHFYLGEAQLILADFAENPAAQSLLYEESLASFQSALALSPRDVRSVLSLASSLDALERYDEAETALSLAIKLDPNSGKPYTAYAAHFHQQKKLEQAEAQYKKAADLTHAPSEWMRLNAIRKEIADKKASEGVPADVPK